ncbi:MAG: hypothetical protein B7Z80_27825 [Rhodospirillales bacterium 20-64-7]|nr:MAG: hypothetical protein B7Z80_27825 [Rhodospirillales bacterium 20-64-7]
MADRGLGMSGRLGLKDRLAARNPASALVRARELLAADQPARAFQLLGIAAQAGLAEAQRELGQSYLRGEGVLRNNAEAARWFKRAAEQGELAASRDLAGLFMFGLRAEALAPGAETLFETASQAGDTEAREPDYATAIGFALPAAEAGDTDAQIMLGFMLATGPAGLRDPAAAEAWYAKAAAAGKPQGHLGTGVLSLSRAESATETFQAIDHLRKAAEAGLPSAHYYLAIVHEKAIGVLPDAAEAARHYDLAAQAGIRNAQAKYGFMLFEGIGIKQNRVEGESAAANCRPTMPRQRSGCAWRPKPDIATRRVRSARSIAPVPASRATRTKPRSGSAAPPRPAIRWRRPISQPCCCMAAPIQG